MNAIVSHEMEHDVAQNPCRLAGLGQNRQRCQAREREACVDLRQQFSSDPRYIMVPSARSELKA